MSSMTEADALTRFRMFDSNKNEWIELEELMTVLKFLDRTWTDERLKELHRILDVNSDGHVDYEEFTAWAFGGNELQADDANAFRAAVARIKPSMGPALERRAEKARQEAQLLSFTEKAKQEREKRERREAGLITVTVVASGTNLLGPSPMPYKTTGKEIAASLACMWQLTGVEPEQQIGSLCGDDTDLQLRAVPKEPRNADGSEDQICILFKKMEGILATSEEQKVQRAQACFEEFDTSGDDIISEVELRRALVICGMTDEEACSCFAAADVNKDGVVKYKEFLDWAFQETPSAARELASGGVKTVYHCTTKTACDSIVNGGFRFPTTADAHNKGLKLGAAVYFGSDPEYCRSEALNTLAGDNPDDRKCVAETLGLVKATVQLGRALSLGNYGVDRFGLTAEEHEVFTEGLTMQHLFFWGYSTVTINECLFTEEVAVYDSHSILELCIAADL